MNRAIICSLYHAIGRAGEVGLIAWDLLQYNYCVLGPEVDWNDRKNGKSAPVTFFNDAHTYLIDWLHSIFCYLMADGSHSFSLQAGMYPEVLHDAANTGKVKGLNKRHTSHGLKHGAADDCTNNPLCNVVNTVCRANWDYSGESIMSSVAGKTLAGWKNPNTQVFPTDTNAFVHDMNVEQYEAFCQILFSKVELPDLHKESRLKPFRDQMVATFLMHKKEYEDDVGKDDLVLVHFMQSAAEVGLTRLTIWDWSAKVRTRFDMMNSASNIIM